MGHGNDQLKLGDYRAICDVCGFEFYASDLKKRWDGLRVCKDDFEYRHPQDVIKTPREKTPPWTRPEQADTFFSGSFLLDENGEDILDHNLLTIRTEDFVSGASSL